MPGSPLLNIDGLSVCFRGEEESREVLRQVSFCIAPGEIMGVVGESGSGKSVAALSVMGLLGATGSITQGSIHFEGIGDLTRLDPGALRAVRGGKIGMIFQEPMTSLNPLMTVGMQVTEVLQEHLGVARTAARREAIDWFDKVGIPNPDLRYHDYPHSLSGGMRQRVMIAMAMVCLPKLLIADEPTTALDVTVQAQILELMKDLRQRHGTAILLITHDMGVIARMADRVAVMYAGEVAEVAQCRDLLTAPAHPYTRSLLAAMPSVKRRLDRLPIIPGQMPSPGAMPTGCRFHPRCPMIIEKCRELPAPMQSLGGGRIARCWRAAAAMESPS